MCGYRRRIHAPFLRFTRSLRHSTVTRSAALRKCISSPERAGLSLEVSRPLYCPWPRCLRSTPFLPFGAALALRPLSIARDLGRCDHDYPRGGGHTSTESTATYSVLGAPASIIGSELSYLAPALYGAPARCPKPSPDRSASMPDVLLCPRTPARNTRRYEHPLFGVSWPYRGGAMQTFTPS
jgi:hypothetical protein